MYLHSPFLMSISKRNGFFVFSLVGIWFKPSKSGASVCIFDCHTQLSSMTNIKERSREICMSFQQLRNLVQTYIFWITNTQQLRSNLNRLFFCICFAIFLHQLLPGLQSIPPSKNFMKSSQTFNISSSPITWFIYVIANSLNFMKSFKTFNLSSSPITWSHIYLRYCKYFKRHEVF